MLFMHVLLMDPINMFDYNNLSPQEQVCFHLSRNDLCEVDNLLSTVDSELKPMLFEQGMRLCEQDDTPLSQQAFATGELFSVELNGVELTLDAVGKQMLIYYQQIYHGQVTEGLRQALLDEQLYQRFYLLQSRRQKVAGTELTESRRHDVSLNIETVKLFVDKPMAKCVKGTKSYQVLHLGYHQIEIKVTGSKSSRLGKQCVLDLHIAELNIHCKNVILALDAEADFRSVDDTLIFRRCYHDVEHEKAFLMFFQACIGCYPLATEQKNAQLHAWFKQSQLLSSSQSVLPILMTPQQDQKTATVIGVVQHKNNQQLINSLAKDGTVDICQTTINRLQLRAHPTQEMYYIRAVTSSGKNLVREDLDHDVNEVVRMGVTNNSLMVFKVNVEKIKLNDARWLHVLANGEPLPTDLEVPLRMIYLTAIPLDIAALKNNMQHQSQYTIEGLLPKEKWCNLPILRYPEKNLRGELRYFYDDTCVVYFKLFSKGIFDIVNVSPSGLCIRPKKTAYHIKNGQQLVVSVPSLGINKACYQVVAIDLTRQLYRLQLNKKHKRTQATMSAIRDVFSTANDQNPSNNCEQKALHKYRFCYLLAAMYLPHLSLTSKTGGETLESSSVCSYRLSGLVDCKASIFVKSNGKEFFKFNDFVTKEMSRGAVDLHQVSQTPLLVGMREKAGKYSRTIDLMDVYQHDTHVFLWQPESIESLPSPIINSLFVESAIEQCFISNEINTRAVAVYHISYLYSLLYRCGCIPSKKRTLLKLAH